MKVSFLVTYYNQKEDVKESMDSIIAIDKPCDWEILVGDDGSTDGTLEEINKYITQYSDHIKLFVMPRELDKEYDSVRRASANRLNLLEHSKGDIYCTLDGDDFYCDTKFIKEAIEIFEKNKDISIIAFGYKYVENGILGDDNILPVGVSRKRVDKKTFLKDFYLPAGGCVHRKCFGSTRIEYIKKLGFFDDNNIVINSLNYGEIYAVNRAIYAYRQTGESVYTSMNKLEQAILNVQGMDVDMRLIDDEFRKSIKRRYASSVIFMYIWRNKIGNIIGNDKLQKYEKGCENLRPSFCLNLLHYKSASIEEKREIKEITKMCKKYAIKEHLKFFLKGFI